MESKPIRIVITLMAIGLLMVVSFAGGVFTGYSLPRQIHLSQVIPFFPTTEPVIQAPQNQPSELDELFTPFWQAWDLVHTQYVDQPVDNQVLLQGAISGMLNSLGDPNTGYMDPFEFQQANAPLTGEYDGIGAWVDTTGEFLTIISPMDGSPAEAAGLRSGDKIIAVDSEDVTGLDPRLVLRRVLGPAGTSVKLTILREENEVPFDVIIVRQKITIQTISGEMLENNIAYVQILQFGERTDRDLRDTLRELNRQNPVGLILDLRNNPGGYLNTAINISSQFIGDGVIMYEDYGTGERITFTSRPGGVATEIPLVVLVNEGSASASEITAGAIQDHGRALLVGSKTFGKGTVQTWTPLTMEAGAVKITVARWLTPNERQIDGIGLTPDIEVEITEEDIELELDPQLEKAEEILLDHLSNN